MARQLLFYESATPLTFARHGTQSLDGKREYAFSEGVNAVPLMSAEFARACDEYAIVFTVAGNDVVPVAVLGLRDQQNLYLGPQAQWKARYVPAFVRRYPFVFASSADGKTLTLCIDEAHPGLNQEGRGQRLFGADGQPSEFTQNVLKFARECQVQFDYTRHFGQRLKELGVLEEMQAQVTSKQGEPLAKSRFLAVSRDKLRALDDATLAGLERSGGLELIHLHLHSMRNFGEVRDRLMKALEEAAPPADTPRH